MAPVWRPNRARGARVFDLDRTRGGQGKREGAGAVDRHTLEMLVCPLTKTRLVISADRRELISSAARLAFPIRKGVPLLAISEARALTEDELARLER